MKDPHQHLNKAYLIYGTYKSIKLLMCLPCLAIYFSMGGLCGKFSNYIGHWCPTKSNYMDGWYFAAWRWKKEYYLPKKERSFIKSSQKKA